MHSVANPLVDMQVNYGGTLHVLEYARATGVKKVAFASSAAVYGDVTEMPVSEDIKCAPVSPYGIDKYASELALDYYAAVHGVPATWLRFFNVFGPRQDPSSLQYFRRRDLDLQRRGQRAPGGRSTIFGDGGSRRATSATVYVGDVVSAICAALRDGNSRVVANVGTGGEISVLQLARTIVELCGGGKVGDRARAGARRRDRWKSRARVDRLRDELGVVAQTSLVDGLRATLA